jgi:hypothetical protein
MRAGVGLVAAVALAGAGCLTRAPATGTPVYALYADLSKIVTTRTRGGWEIDAHEVEEGSTKALTSVCQTTEVTRADLRTWLDQTILDLGGPVEDAYVRLGKKKRKVRELLELTRIRLLLDRAVDRAATDCPFWLAPDDRFAGVHGDADRLVLMFESSGTFFFLPDPGGGTTFGGGGSGRLLAGWGFGQFFTLILGAEAGAAGTFPPDTMMSGSRALVPRFFGLLPLLARFHYYTYQVELEGAFGWQFSEADPVPRPGFRAAFALGASVLRVASILPYGTIGLEVERFRTLGGGFDTYFGGLYRVGFNLDPKL